MKDKIKDEIKFLGKYSQELTEKIVGTILDNIKDSFKDESEGATLSLDFALTRLDYWKDSWQGNLEDSTECIDAQDLVDSCLTELEDECEELIGNAQEELTELEEETKGTLNDFTKLADHIYSYEPEKATKLVELIAHANKLDQLPTQITELN